jgi:hypothetical protein
MPPAAPADAVPRLRAGTAPQLTGASVESSVTTSSYIDPHGNPSRAGIPSVVVCLPSSTASILTGIMIEQHTDGMPILSISVSRCRLPAGPTRTPTSGHAPRRRVNPRRSSILDPGWVRSIYESARPGYLQRRGHTRLHRLLALWGRQASGRMQSHPLKSKCAQN